MGTRINVVMDTDGLDYCDQTAVLTRLAAANPAALAVRDYWDTIDPDTTPKMQEEWTADPVMAHEKHFRSYTGPGSLFLKIGEGTAKIRTGGRWRGFVSIAPLCTVHLSAFRAIAEALGASQAAYFPDCEDVWDIFYDGGSFGLAVPILESYFGPPQSVSNLMPDGLARDANLDQNHEIGYHWYIESISRRSIV